MPSSDPASRRPRRGQLAHIVLGWVSSVVLLAATGCGTTTTQPVAAPSPVSATPSSSPTPAPDHLSVIVVRAAEGKAGQTDDPPLSTAGIKRARHLATRLADEPGVAVYVTPYQETQSTAMPTANAWKVAPSLYDERRSVSELVGRVRGDNTRGTVLIVGHRDDTPRIVEALCDCGVDPIDASSYGLLYHVTFSPTGQLASIERVENY